MATSSTKKFIISGTTTTTPFSLQQAAPLDRRLVINDYDRENNADLNGYAYEGLLAVDVTDAAQPIPYIYSNTGWKSVGDIVASDPIIHVCGAISTDHTLRYNFQKDWFGYATENVAHGSYLSTIRNNSSSYDYYPQYGSGIAWGESDTHGYIYTSYSNKTAYIGGGNQGRLVWYDKIVLQGALDTTLASYVKGPDSARNSAIAGYNGTTGKIIKSSDILIDGIGIYPYNGSKGNIGTLEVGTGSNEFYQMTTKYLHAWTLESNGGKTTTHRIKLMPTEIDFEYKDSNGYHKILSAATNTITGYISGSSRLVFDSTGLHFTSGTDNNQIIRPHYTNYGYIGTDSYHWMTGYINTMNSLSTYSNTTYSDLYKAKSNSVQSFAKYTSYTMGSSAGSSVTVPLPYNCFFYITGSLGQIITASGYKNGSSITYSQKTTVTASFTAANYSITVKRILSGSGGELSLWTIGLY